MTGNMIQLCIYPISGIDGVLKTTIYNIQCLGQCCARVNVRNLEFDSHPRNLCILRLHM